MCHYPFSLLTHFIFSLFLPILHPFITVLLLLDTMRAFCTLAKTCNNDLHTSCRLAISLCNLSLAKGIYIFTCIYTPLILMLLYAFFTHNRICIYIFIYKCTKLDECKRKLIESGAMDTIAALSNVYNNKVFMCIFKAQTIIVMSKFNKYIYTHK
jgi:hypothetical protein